MVPHLVQSCVCGGCRVLSTFAYLSLPLEREKKMGVESGWRSPKRITEVVFSILFFFPLINFFWLFFATWDLNLMAMESGFWKISTHIITHWKRKKEMTHICRQQSASSQEKNWQPQHVSQSLHTFMSKWKWWQIDSKKQVNSPSPLQTFSSYIIIAY